MCLCVYVCNFIYNGHDKQYCLYNYPSIALYLIIIIIIIIIIHNYVFPDVM